jgi:predicted nucleotidyltransferase
VINQSVINEAVRRLSERFRPERIILFGSYARGNADDKSDLDFLVICPLRKSRQKLAAEMDRALEGMNLPRDIIVFSAGEFEEEKAIPGTVARYAWQEGKLLYERK